MDSSSTPLSQAVFIQMKRTPIIVPGQVYLHSSVEEYVPRSPFEILAGCEQEHVQKESQYLVVTKATRGEIQFKGPGFSGMHEAELFLERFGPVDPTDLSLAEAQELIAILDNSSYALSTGWVEPDEEDEE